MLSLREAKRNMKQKVKKRNERRITAVNNRSITQCRNLWLWASPQSREPEIGAHWRVWGLSEHLLVKPVLSVCAQTYFLLKRPSQGPGPQGRPEPVWTFNNRRTGFSLSIRHLWSRLMGQLPDAAGGAAMWKQEGHDATRMSLWDD